MHFIPEDIVLSTQMHFTVPLLMSTFFVGLASKLSLNPDHRCVACNDKIMDGYGHHVSVCAVKGDRIKRHKLIRDIIIDCCYTLLGLPYLHMSLSKTTREKHQVLDVALTCPLQQKYLHDASVTAGFACNEFVCISNRNRLYISSTSFINFWWILQRC